MVDCVGNSADTVPLAIEPPCSSVPTYLGMGGSMYGEYEPRKRTINPVAFALMAALALGGLVVLSVMMMP